MLRVAEGTADTAVLTAGTAPLAEDIVVTSIACLYLNIFTQGDIERLMDVVALGAG